jgi:hypothetical protein
MTDERPEKTCDLARTVGVSPETLTGWIKAERIGGYKLGGRWFTWRSEVAKMIQVPGTPKPEPAKPGKPKSLDEIQASLFTRETDAA